MDNPRNQRRLDLKKANTVRIYYRILYVSDITSMDGESIIDKHVQRKHHSLGRTSELQWPVQEKLGENIMQEWKQALLRITNRNLKLIKPLGKWFTDLDLTWEYSISQTTADILDRTKNDTVTCHKYKGGLYRKIFDTEGTAGGKKNNSVLAPTVKKGSELCVRGKTRTHKAKPTQRHSEIQQEEWKQYFTENVTIRRQEENLALYRQTPGGEINLVTDGRANFEAGLWMDYCNRGQRLQYRIGKAAMQLYPAAITTPQNDFLSCMHHLFGSILRERKYKNWCPNI